MEIKVNSLEDINDYVKLFKSPEITIQGEPSGNWAEVLMSDFWPKAVPEGLIVRNEEQVGIRAKSILYSYKIYDNAEGPPSKTLCDYANFNTKVLDYGCGNGQVVEAAKQCGFSAIGYDIVKLWENPNKSLSTNFEKIKDGGPYNFILLYDVIDHIGQEEDIIKEFRKVRELSNSTTKVLVRTHPWTSRHASHSYYKLNKAWAHLFLDNKQLQEYTDQDTFFKLKRPIADYTRIFKDSGFKIDKRDVVRTPLEDFSSNIIAVELANKFEADIGWAKEVMQYEFIDFQLSMEITQ